VIATLALALTAATSSAALVAARSPGLAVAPTARVFASAAAAIAAALPDELGERGDTGGVVAFGELHQTTATTKIPSALHRFTTELLPAFAPRLSHLVVETWVTNGHCGEAERAVTADVERTTQRPASTESEIEALIRVAEENGVAPRILSISCADYAAMRGGGGAGESGSGVDYDRILRVTARALEAAIVRALGDRRAAAAVRPRLVAVYGGALHNDLTPEVGLEAYSFAPRVLAATLGRYHEIDLVVPEYAASSAAVRAQPWWRAYRRARRPGATVLVRRAARSFVVVFPTQASSRR
jgi:hypothetical protein